MVTVGPVVATAYFLLFLHLQIDPCRIRRKNIDNIMTNI
jgi:hypothetical protein